MLKRMMRMGLICAIALLIASVAMAQQAPEPVVRMGDWVEIGDDAWINFIGAATIKYNVAENHDFEGDIQDAFVPDSFNATGGRFCERGAADAFCAEIRLGADFRYQKNFRMRILLEAESVYDGNLIDDRANSNDGTENPTHVERFWVDYTFEQVPLRIRVGADLWCLDLGCVVSDDDPGYKLWYNAGDIELRAWTALQNQGVRLELTNDNNDVYYMFGARYTGMKGHTFAVDFLYDRDRFNQRAAGRESDFFLIMPAWRGQIGNISVFAEGLFGFGEVRTPTVDFDVANWAVMASAEINLGQFRPYVGVIYASGDDDENDTDLNGFHPVNHADVLLIGLGPFPNGEGPIYDQETPCAANSPICGGIGGLHTITNPFNNNVGNTQHTRATLDSEFSNAGTFLFIVGSRVSVAKQHNLDVWYSYHAVADSTLMEAQARGITGDPNYSIDESMFHSIGGHWTWTLSRHFDIQLRGNATFAADSMKDIAETVTTCGNGTQACEGEDAHLAGEVQFRGRF
ncbi:hypothetical protein [Candidatus Entotheonella palauensis]|uniref:hypothetical protein n=1 Tax=Candidatus Entotheonella palauensis TaxID=93172 RepID=UPI000B7D8D38|nr:hypothetical protein [Candidatus Entotheonella palauensis]